MASDGQAWPLVPVVPRRAHACPPLPISFGGLPMTSPGTIGAQACPGHAHSCPADFDFCDIRSGYLGCVLKHIIKIHPGGLKMKVGPHDKPEA
jgi:hypothetical protein